MLLDNGVQQGRHGKRTQDTAAADRTFFLVCLIFESGSHYVVLAGLEWRALPASACLPSAGMKGPHYHFQPRYNILLDGSTSPAEWTPSLNQEGTDSDHFLGRKVCMSSQLSAMSGVAALWIRFWVKTESCSVQLWRSVNCPLGTDIVFGILKPEPWDQPSGHGITGDLRVPGFSHPWLEVHAI